MMWGLYEFCFDNCYGFVDCGGICFIFMLMWIYFGYICLGIIVNECEWGWLRSLELWGSCEVCLLVWVFDLGLSFIFCMMCLWSEFWFWVVFEEGFLSVWLLFLVLNSGFVWEIVFWWYCGIGVMFILVGFVFGFFCVVVWLLCVVLVVFGRMGVVVFIVLMLKRIWYYVEGDFMIDMFVFEVCCICWENVEYGFFVLCDFIDLL